MSKVSTLLLTPICPHTCDHIWRSLLKKPGSALKAGWPQLPTPDAGLQRQAAYIEKLRDRLANIISKETQVKKQKKGQVSGPPVKVRPFSTVQCLALCISSCSQNDWA